MKRRFMMCISAILAIPLAVSCGEVMEKPVPAPEPEVIAGFITEPEHVAPWQHSVYVFSDGSCTFMDVADCLDEVEVPEEYLNAKDGTAVAIASPSSGNLDRGPAADGLPASLYRLSVKDISSEVPDIWAGRGTLAGGVVMSPLTMDLKFELVDVPEEIFKSMDFSLPSLSDAYSIFDGTFSIKSGSASSRGFSVLPGDASVQYRMFPMASDITVWTFSFSMHLYTGADIEGSFNVTVPLGAGSSNLLTLDFSSYENDGKCTVSLSTEAYGTGTPKKFSRQVEVTHIQPENRYYDVDVLQEDGSWKSLNPSYALCSNAPDYHTQIWNDWNNSKKLRDTMSFVSVIDDFAGPVTVRVVNKKSFSTVAVRPTSYGVEPVRIDGNTIEITIPDHDRRKLSVEFDGDRYHNLMIFGDRPDPDRPDPQNIPAGMKYYGPGEHEAEWITLREGETLYIDEGATVYAKVNVVGDNTAIKGRGVLSGAHLAHTGDMYASGHQLIETNASKVGTRQYFTVEGITVIDSPSWTFSIYNTDHVLIDNMKMICWILNGDGIDLCSVDDATVRDCFIRTYDDCITLKVNHLSKSDTKNVTIKKNLIWADYARGIVIGPEAGGNTGGSIHDVLVEDCIVLEYPTKLLQTSSTGYNCDGAGLSISQYPAYGFTTAGTMCNITFDNIIVDRIGKAGRPIAIWQKEGQDGGLLDKIVFRNIAINCPGGTAPSHIYTNGGKITGLVMENIMYNGTPLQDSGMWIIDGTDVDITYR